MQTASKITIAIILCLAIGGLSGYLSGSSGINAWYQSLNKPVFTPPGWVFGLVWPILYGMMGLSAGLIWSRGLARREVFAALLIFAVQLALNLLWSPLFFKMHHIHIALLDAIALWFAVAVVERSFWKIQPAAAVLLWPYWVWIGFAVTLNATFWKMN